MRRMADRDICSRALRVIDQVLETRRIDLFDIKCFGNEFYLQAGDPQPPYVNLVELLYPAADISSLNAKPKMNRQRAFKLVNFEALPELLRAVGRRVDENRARLLRVT